VDDPAEPWPTLPKHYWGIVGTRRPGATVLVATTEGDADEDAGLLVEQQVGAGRVVFLGVDSTWRWRSEPADRYHARFWSQLVLGASAERLLVAQSGETSFGSDRLRYGIDEPVTILLRSEPAKPPTNARVVTAGGIVAATVPLQPHAHIPGLYSGKLGPLPEGDYRVQPDSGDVQPPANSVHFSVRPPLSEEMTDLAPNHELLRALAEASGGAVFRPEDAAGIVDRLAQRITRVEHIEECRPWRDEPAVWWTLGVLLTLLTLEWGYRKRLDLP
jgi:hypothetical protein